MVTLKIFYAYVLKYKAYFLSYVAIAGVSQLAANLQPFFLQWITSALLAQEYTIAFNMGVWLTIILVASTLLYALSMLLTDRSALKSSIQLQMDVMRKIHELDFTYHTEKSSGKLISIMKRGEDAFLNMYDILNRDMYFLFIALAAMMYAFSGVDTKYVAISALALIVSSFVTVLLIKLNLKSRVSFIRADDAVSAARVDNLINFDTVKYFAKESYEQDRLLQLLHTWYATGQKYFNTFRYFDLTISNFSNLAIGAMILIAIMDLRAGLIDISQFVLISSFSAAFFPRLGSIVFSLRSAAKRFSDLELYFEVLKEDVTVKDATHPQRIKKLAGRILFDRVGFVYHTTNPVFSDFSLNIAPGESVALVGLSGSGKTTLVKLLMRMYDLNSGHISIDGVDIRDMSKNYLRSLIGIVPQDPLMFNHTIRYNISYAKPQASQDQVWEALRAAHLDDFVRSLPDGLDTKVGERGIKLSGGQRQRLAIARVLIEKPRIIVMDEATSSLDSESEGAVQDAFWDMAKDSKSPKTSIIIAHRLSTVMRTDRIIVLKEGTIAESGTHRNLLKRKGGLYKHLWSLQQNGFLADSD